ncbi:phospholipid carrier-dependent glycosyltransferase [Chitinophaga agrisoli]|uniref:Phospholipid carrier-dependent glycosyltransferase n=1 Tax=Chitinophaga agrisoli TaxID=2607653 RepID=A0A5B2W5Q7_9BACT|nr:glycosyltransferase family 39 protein [Chitinophaga agrisoli]KAA2245707.1 phospholipid carrier-dependent glycosyltransferase [Chitinophaga agrisoli]
MKYLIIAIAAGLLFIPFLGAVPLVAPQEAHLAAAAWDMIMNGHYAMPPADLNPDYTPPLFLWLQAGSMAVFGNSAFAARFPNAIIGILTLLTGYAISQKAGDERLGAWWALVYAACWLPHLLFKSGMTAPLFNYFFFLFIYCAYRINYSTAPMRPVILSGVCLGLAMLTQGPAVLILGLLVLLFCWIASKGSLPVKAGQLAMLVLCACLPTAIWLSYAGFAYGWAPVMAFLRHQLGLQAIAGHWYNSAYFYYRVLWAGSFPACIFLFNYLRGRKPAMSVYSAAQPLELKDLKTWMWVLLWVSLLAWPSSLCCLPLSFLAAWQVYRLAEGRQHLLGWNVGLLLLTGILIGIALMLLPLAGVYRTALLPYAQDPFLRARLQANVSWSLWETGYGLLYIILVVMSGVLLLQRKYRGGLLCLFISTLVTIQLTLWHFIPKLLAVSF